MKKLLAMLPILFCVLFANAQQTEDEVYIGKGKTLGAFRGPTVKPLDGQYSFTGQVVGICTRDCCNRKLTSCTMIIKREDSLVSIGTNDYGFTVPKSIVGRTVTVQSVDPRLIRERRPIRKDSQKGVQIAATGIKFID
jgi:hypothetical protein